MIIAPDRSILREAAARALGEDIGPIDLTSHALIPEDLTYQARIFVKEAGILSGNCVAEIVYQELDPQIEVQSCLSDGSPIEPGQTVMELQGNARRLLSGERVALNFLQHLSGIATQTRKFVDAVSGTSTRILDTRKTIPGLRALQKYAVACGGGTNHRFGLYDAFMIKDNHVSLLGNQSDQAFQETVEKARRFDPDVPLIAEADTIDQVKAWLKAGVDRILLDNMTNEEMTEAVTLCEGKCPTEASGNMTLERVGEVAACGVDFISIGALTHHIDSLDFSLEIIESN
ncbi:MAG: carboxylating nicotinate-nucleotide diphosphorylase [Verrucomicrobiota bacterium]